MVTAQSPHSGRRPLQPKNLSTAPIITAKPNTKPADRARQLDNYYCNKENVAPTYNYSSTPVKKEYKIPIESLDASLADELTAIREKLERLRIDKEKTEKMLRERGLMLDLQMKEIVDRGEAQKQLEIEVDRLYRLKEIKLAACMRISPLRSLRVKEEERKMKQDEVV
ncbi:high mobility group B protein 6 [Sesamum indicum]|uniref:High mobility group B protein 6 n=1 Tax=Sesamum indicum TaxID=4182 RepID=A0A6I9UBC8_SESIN|nr:high mobility group B protein 6 [Sesamum indicum]